MSKGKPKVLVVGAGPVGMFAALSLAKQGIPVQIVDTGLWACSHSYALALYPQSLELFKQAGLFEQVCEAANPVRTIGFYDSSGMKAQIRIPDETGCPMVVIRQSALEDLLEKALLELQTPVLWRHEVSTVSQDAAGVLATVQKYKKKLMQSPVAQETHTEWAVSKTTDLNVDFVLGADGHNSNVRRALAFEFPEVGTAQYYAVFEFKSNLPPSDEIRIVLAERTTDVLWPLPDGHYRWSFQLPDYSDTEAEQLKDRLVSAGFGHFPTKRLKDRVPAAVEWGVPPALDQVHLAGLTAERAPWFTSSIQHLTWRTIVRFERRLAPRFGEDRIWLAGDSAHLTLPAGVQSMNLGLAEANDLCTAFSRILTGTGTAEELLECNQRWTAIWRLLHGVEGSLHPTPVADPWIRDRADRLLSCLPGHGDLLTQLASQLGLELQSSANAAV